MSNHFAFDDASPRPGEFGITQEQLDLIHDAKAFNPDPVHIEAPGWLNWLAGIGFIALFGFLAVFAI